MILATWGLEKSGKTTIALTFPQPIFHADFDLRLEGALHRFNGLQIESVKYPIPLQLNKQLHGIRELWERWLLDYVAVLENKKLYQGKTPFATIIIDTSTQMRKVCNDRTLQIKQEADIAKGKALHDIRERLLEIEYGEPNTILQPLIYAPRQYNKHLVLCHYAADEYKKQLVDGKIESMPTGKKILDGFKLTEGLADIVLHTYKKEAKTGKEFHGIITKSGLHAGLEDMDFVDPSYDQIVDTYKMLLGE